MMSQTKLSARTALLLSASLLPIAPALAQEAPPVAQAGTQGQTTGQGPGTPESPQPVSEQPVDEFDPLTEVVVTGQTTRDRPLITSSADITFADRGDIDRRAPRSTADLLELVPGIFVEGTAGELSNNYSVRGLQGGGQRFIQLEEDGFPIIYQGGGADFFFQQDLTIDRLEAVKGGSSGVLTVNGAGATINFISRRPNFTEEQGILRVQAADFGLKRAEFYYSTPLVADQLAFNIGGFVQSNPGFRENPFDYDGYRLKAMLEYRFGEGGFLRFTGKIGDIKAAYYATQPYAFNDGEPGGIPGLDTQSGNIGGDAFTRISVPVSTFVEADGFRDFRYSEGVRVKTKQGRIDFEAPLTDSIDLFARGRYLDLSYDFNGLFPGSGTGNAGLASAVTYLTPGAASPINDLLTAGRAAFPTAARFGVRNLRTGVVLGSNQAAELNALNGNGFLQQTTLNHDFQEGHDFGVNAGARWEADFGGVQNSLTLGVIYFDVARSQNQSATAAVVNDVRTNSDIYDIVALNAGNQVIGTLSDNGLISYGNWGAGIRRREDESFSIYANDEIAIGDLRVDAGIRWEQLDSRYDEGNAAAVNQPVPAGVGGVVRTVGLTFNGTFTTVEREQDKVAWTVGANYLITPNLSVYARYADGFQTNNTDPITQIELYEAGVRFQYGRVISASATYFETYFNDQFYNFIDPSDPTRQTAFLADLRTKGFEFDVQFRPVDWFQIDAFGVFQDPTLNNLSLNGVPDDTFNGNRPERTPKELVTISPIVRIPRGLGDIFARFKYVGDIFADSGNGVALPDYWVTSAGFNLNLTERLEVNFVAENIFDEIGLTEGNPRQGQRQNISDGFFYARGIPGPTYTGSVTFRF
ncbi:TonB-dependent siderophore receptor [Sphingomonas lenta]|uniref:TonB-dependent receptor n=1 Tax=Sphingomonas lenta TaxID=1141887 RepID=A0A2A2SE95_9SPHN|nr:TonB-dependent receptor [Sphingomonas lenta]PAX07614.1 TonB-dependent receptor [Sphingomonas lenta]